MSDMDEYLFDAFVEQEYYGRRAEAISEMIEGLVWEVNYISCEGNKRLKFVKTDHTADESFVADKLMEDCGYDDAPAMFVSVHIVYGHDENDIDMDWRTNQ